MKIKIFISTALVSALMSQEKSYNIDEIVTSASGFAQELKDAPASISVVDGKELNSLPVRDLGDALSGVAGVSIDQSVGKTGGYNISIRGMPSSYTLILIDGKRQNTTSAGLPNGFTETMTSFMPPISAIERIEVIRGPASTLYGSDAIGGIVNIITKKNFQSWSGSVTLDTILQEEKRFGNLFGLSLWSAGPLDEDKKWSLILRLKEQYRAKVPTSSLRILPNVTLARNQVVGLSQSNVHGIGARLGYTSNKENYYYFDYDHGMQWYDNSQNLLGTTGTTGGYSRNLYFMRNNLIFAHNGEYENFSTDTSIQYISTLNKGRLVTPSAAPAGSPLIGLDRQLLGQDVIFEHKSVFGIGSFNTMSAGAQYWFTSLHDRAVPSPFMYQHNGSLFVENESVFLDHIFLTTGMRGHYNSAFGFNISPRVYFVYQPLEDSAVGDIVFKGGISTGYKTPTVSQLVKGINGLTSQGTVPTYGNPSLKPEQSINYELGIINETAHTELSVTGFFIQFRNKIQSVGVPNGSMIPVLGGGVCNASNGNSSCSYSVNADRAISYGVETSFMFKPYDFGYGSVGLNLSYTFNETQETSGAAKGLPLTNIPKHSLDTKITYDFLRMSFYLKGEMRAKQLRNDINARTLSALEAFRAKNPGLGAYYKPYFLLHLGSSYRIDKDLKINFAVYNLLNHDFVDYQPGVTGDNNSATFYNHYNYVREGRRYYLSLNIDF